MSIENNIDRPQKVIKHKDIIIEQLQDAFASGNLVLDESEFRISKAEKAYEIAELDSLVIDLPKTGTNTEITEAETIKCNMSTKNLVGTILKTRKLNIEASMSTITINYLEEELIKGIQEINVQMNMSNLVLYLPDDVVVENNLSENMITFKEYRNKYYDSKNAKTLIKITGTARMTTIKVKRKKYWFFSKKKKHLE